MSSIKPLFEGVLSESPVPKPQPARTGDPSVDSSAWLKKQGRGRFDASRRKVDTARRKTLPVTREYYESVVQSKECPMCGSKLKRMTNSEKGGFYWGCDGEAGGHAGFLYYIARTGPSDGGEGHEVNWEQELGRLTDPSGP
jgi:hypothetical protein